MFLISNYPPCQCSNITLTRTMSSRARTAKRRLAAANRTFGAPSEADENMTPANVSSATAFSTRTLKENRLLPLTVICARLFAASFPSLSKDPLQWGPSEKWQVIVAGLKDVPYPILQSLYNDAQFLLPSLTHPRPGQRGASRLLVRIYSTVQIVFYVRPLHHFDQ